MRNYILIALITAFIMSGVWAAVDSAAPAPGKEAGMLKEYQARDFGGLKGMKGFSDTLLNNHFKLYQGYVTNVNLLSKALAGMDPDAKNPQWAELKRRFAFEFDGMRMHEYYFQNLGGKADVDKSSEFYKELEKQFGSFDAWKKDFMQTGSMRGVGWAVLYWDNGFDNGAGQFMNGWVAEHQNSQLVGAQPILVMDVWEHAYMTDYQLDRGAYIENFMKNVNWQACQSRFDDARRMAGAGMKREAF